MPKASVYRQDYLKLNNRPIRVGRQVTPRRVRESVSICCAQVPLIQQLEGISDNIRAISIVIAIWNTIGFIFSKTAVISKFGLQLTG